MQLPPLSVSLRLLPYGTGLLGLGTLLQIVLLGIEIAIAAPELAGDSTGGPAVTAIVVTESIIEAFAILTPAAALIILAIVTLRRRSRVTYWWVVGILTTVVVCTAGIIGASSQLPDGTGTGDSVATADPPLWTGILGTAAVLFTAVGLVGSIVLLALPATRRSLRPRAIGPAVQLR